MLIQIFIQSLPYLERSGTQPSRFPHECEGGSQVRLQMKEEYVLCNDAINTFCLRLYGVGHMVKDYSYNERGNPMSSLHGLLFSISSMSFICTIPQT